MKAKIKAMGWKVGVASIILTILAWLGVFASAVASSTMLFVYLLVAAFVVLAIYDYVKSKKARLVEDFVAAIAMALVPFAGISIAFAGSSMAALEFFVVDAVFGFIGAYIGSEVKF